MAFNAMQEENIAAYGGGAGYGGFGGGWSMIIVIVVVLWLLFKDGRNDHVDHGYGYGYGGGCGPCVQPTFKDESNYEEERNINSKLCKIEMEQQACCCKEIETTHCEGEKTRDLIRCEAEKQWMYKLNEKDRIIQTLESNAFTERKFDQLAALIGCTNNKIEKLECEVPKRPPVFAECTTPNTHDIDCDDRRFRDFPRRGRCDDFGFGGCCA